MQQKHCVFSPLCSLVLINNKASNTHLCLTTFFSALGPHTEHWSKAPPTLILPLVMHHWNSTGICLLVILQTRNFTKVQEVFLHSKNLYWLDVHVRYITNYQTIRGIHLCYTFQAHSWNSFFFRQFWGWNEKALSSEWMSD